LDLRRLNDIVVLDEFEIPKISELIHQLHGMKYFTRIDLKDGFFQVKIEKEDCQKTAFFTGNRLMQFTCMPQGYKNSPAIFQRCMSIVLQDLLGLCCLVYIDDILVFGKTIDEHSKNLELVLNRLNSYGLLENREKRKECVEVIEFLGYEISYNTIKPLLKRAQGIVDFSSPKSKKQLQRFLGMLNYDRNFINGITELAKPIYELLGGKVKFIWDTTHENAFNKLKDEWKKNLELRIPDISKRFTLETDASNVGLGAVLLQEGKPVVFISRSLSKSEKNYSITEKESLACLWAMEKLRYYLTGKEFDLVTDHKAIEEIKKKKDFGSAKMHRWFDRLERFQFKVKYKPGQQMILADALSRSANEEVKMGEDFGLSIETKVLREHERLNLRRAIKKDLKKLGILVNKEYENVYRVQEENGKMLRKHESQLKRVETGKLDHMVSNQ
jgi:hypothetical protein